MDKDSLILVTGAGGFIGGHLISSLVKQGFRKIRAADIKPITEWHQKFDSVNNLQLDLMEREGCEQASRGVRYVYNLAADMGGMGFIELNKTECMLSVLINTNLLLAAKQFGIERFFFSSSACVYAANKQTEASLTPLKESDAYPAMPEDGYGWEKLFGERMCRHFREDYGIQTRIARYHNIYGPHGTYEGNRTKAPAALCTKIAWAKLTGKHEIEIWGDGEQTRSFTYIDDCIKGTQEVMNSMITDPINVGSSELVSINELVDIIEEIAGIKVVRKYNLKAPQGVRGRNSDNTLIKLKLEWEPSISLKEGLAKTYQWIYSEIKERKTEPCLII